MTYSDFEARWKPAGGAERANYGLFLQDLCDLIGVPHPDPTIDNPAQVADRFGRLRPLLDTLTAWPIAPDRSGGVCIVYVRLAPADALALIENYVNKSVSLNRFIPGFGTGH